MTGRRVKEAEDEREMEDSETWLISFVILPDSKQTYRLKPEIDYVAHAYLIKCEQSPSMFNNIY